MICQISFKNICIDIKDNNSPFIVIDYVYCKPYTIIIDLENLQLSSKLMVLTGSSNQ